GAAVTRRGGGQSAQPLGAAARRRAGLEGLLRPSGTPPPRTLSPQSPGGPAPLGPPGTNPPIRLGKDAATLVTTRIQSTRRRLGTSRHGRAERRRPAPWPLLASVARGTAVGRLDLASLGHVYAAGGVVLALVVSYLMVGSQTTQTSYQLDHLR